MDEKSINQKSGVLRIGEFGESGIDSGLEDPRYYFDIDQLTPGEKLFLYRIRVGMSQGEMAVDYNIPIGVYRMMEFDQLRAMYVTLGGVQEGETYAILRRRSKKTRSELALELGVPSYMITRMEQGMASPDTLRNYWAINGL